MTLNQLLNEQQINTYMTNMSEDELLTMMEGISACGNFVKDGTYVELLLQAYDYDHSRIAKHTNDVYACRLEIKKAIADKLKELKVAADKLKINTKC